MTNIFVKSKEEYSLLYRHFEMIGGICFLHGPRGMDLMLNEREDLKAEFDIPSMGRNGLEQKLEQFKDGR